jgi:hypothetical protein
MIRRLVCIASGSRAGGDPECRFEQGDEASPQCRDASSAIAVARLD